MPPLYTFECQKCKGQVDVMRDYEGYRDPPEGPCPHCKEAKPEWEKILHAPLNRYYFMDRDPLK